MASVPPGDDSVDDHVSAAYRSENVALHGNQEEMLKIVAAGPRGALALVGLAVVVLMAIWLAFFVFVFLPRGAIG